MKINNVLNGNIPFDEYLNYYNIVITYEKLPFGVNGLVFSYCNIYNIMINNCLPINLKLKTILHEIYHIELNHLRQCNGLDIKKMEQEIACL